MIDVALLMASVALMLIGYAGIRTQSFYFGNSRIPKYSFPLKVVAVAAGICELSFGVYLMKNYVF